MKRNVFLIWIDSLSWKTYDELARNGRLPVLSSLAQKGVLFPQTIAAATTTSPCTGSLFTGKFTPNHGVRSLSSHQLNSTIPTLAEHLQANGYKTAAFASGPLSPSLQLDRGFKVYQWRKPSENLYGNLKEQLVNILRYPAQDPWFIFLHLWEPHFPYWLPDLGEKQRLRDKLDTVGRYHEAIIRLDQQLGDLFNHIDFEQSIVVALADHGELVGNLSARLRHWLQTKTQTSPLSPAFVHQRHGSHLLDSLVRVPLFIRADGLLSPQQINTMVRQVDVAPTIAALCELDWPTKMDGKPLFDENGRFHPPPPFAYFEAVGRVSTNTQNWLIGSRTPKWKYITAPLNPDQLTLLFDLEKDPDEQHTIAHLQPDIVNTMRYQMESVLGKPIKGLEWPESDMNETETAKLNDRLHELGYL